MRFLRPVVMWMADGGSSGQESAKDFQARILGAKMPVGEDFLGIEPTQESADKAARAAAKAAPSNGDATAPPQQSQEPAPASAGDTGADPAQGAGETPTPEPTAAQPPASGDGAGATEGETGQSPKEIATQKLLEKYGGKKASVGAIDLGKLQTMPAAERAKVQRVLTDNFELGEDGQYRMKASAAARTLAAQRQQPAAPASAPSTGVDERGAWAEAREKERKYLETILEPESVDEALRSKASQDRIKEAAEGKIGQLRAVKHQESIKAYQLEVDRAVATRDAFYERHPDAREGELSEVVDSWFTDIPQPIAIALINNGWLDLEKIYEAASSQLNFSRALSEAFEEGQKNPSAQLRTGGAPSSDTRGTPRGAGGQSPKFKSDSEFKAGVLGAGQFQSFESLLKD